MLFVCHPKILHKFSIIPRETEDNAYAAFWGYKQIALWYVMAFFVVILVTGRYSGRLGDGWRVIELPFPV